MVDSADNSPAARAAEAKEPPSLGKGQPTPSRREREAAQRRPLVADRTKEARRAERAKLIEQRERARIGMAKGEERYLPVRDRGPQKRFVRDFVDARTGVGEFIIPLMFLVIVITFVPGAEVQLVAMLALWLFFLIAIVEGFYIGWRVRRKLAEKFGEERVERGVRWYAAMRGLQLRVMRLPKPQVKRGQYPD